MVVRAEQKSALISKTFWILALLAIIIGCTLWYYLWYRRPRPISEVIPAQVEEAYSVQLLIWDEEEGGSSPGTPDNGALSPEQVKELGELLDKGVCRRAGSGRGLGKPDRLILGMGAERIEEYPPDGLVTVMLNEHYILLNTHEDINRPEPLYEIVEGGEELAVFPGFCTFGTESTKNRVCYLAHRGRIW